MPWALGLIWLSTPKPSHYINGQVPWSSMKAVTGFNLLGEHFSPAVAVIAPFYKLWPHTETLLVAQVALIGVKAGLITAAGVASCGARIGVGVGIVYALGWGTQGVASFDFHEVAFALSLLAICYIRLLRREFVAAALWALPLMLVQEDSVFLVLGIALVLLDYRRWRWSAALIAYAIGTFAFIVGWLIPHLSYSGR